MLATQPKTFDKRDRAIKAALAALGAEAKEGTDFELEKILTVSGQKTVTRYQWNKLDEPAYQPKIKDRVHNIHDQVDGVLRPDIHGTVLVVGPTVSEVKWDKPAPWGQLQNCLNRHLAPIATLLSVTPLKGKIEPGMKITGVLEGKIGKIVGPVEDDGGSGK